MIEVSTARSIRRALLGGFVVAGALVFGLGGWVYAARFMGAVIATGALVVDTNLKKVQHPTGGVVEKLFVREGDAVRAGDVLIRLNETIARANYEAITKTIYELSARQARLVAERDELASPLLPEHLASVPEFRRLMAEEISLFELRATARAGLKKQFSERIQQLREQALGMAEQISAKKKEIDLISLELTGVRDLFKKNLIPFQRVTALERDAARLQGEKGALISGVAQVKGKITETELQIIQVDQDMRAEVGRELAETRTKLAELIERQSAAQDQLQRIEVRAPQDGVVHQLSVHTEGGVINSGDVVMYIVPKDDELKAEIRVAPQDIDHIRVGQKAVVRFTAFNQRTTPELQGEVSLVAADIAADQKTASPYYVARVQIPPEEIGRLNGLRLTPGMPLEAFVQTDARTVASYIAKPITDRMARAFRER